MTGRHDPHPGAVDAAALLMDAIDDAITAQATGRPLPNPRHAVLGSPRRVANLSRIPNANDRLQSLMDQSPSLWIHRGIRDLYRRQQAAADRAWFARELSRASAIEARSTTDRGIA